MCIFNKIQSNNILNYYFDFDNFQAWDEVDFPPHFDHTCGRRHTLRYRSDHRYTGSCSCSDHRYTGGEIFSFNLLLWEENGNFGKQEFLLVLAFPSWGNLLRSVPSSFLGRYFEFSFFVFIFHEFMLHLGYIWWKKLSSSLKTFFYPFCANFRRSHVRTWDLRFSQIYMI